QAWKGVSIPPFYGRGWNFPGSAKLHPDFFQNLQLTIRSFLKNLSLQPGRFWKSSTTGSLFFRNSQLLGRTFPETKAPSYSSTGPGRSLSKSIGPTTFFAECKVGREGGNRFF